MSCPHCAATVTTALSRRTTLGYRMVRRHARAGGPTTSAQARRSTTCPAPTDGAMLVALGRLQDTLSLRNVAEMVLTHGFTVTHETVRA